jgi:hypothetical protein
MVTLIPRFIRPRAVMTPMMPPPTMATSREGVVVLLLLAMMLKGSLFASKNRS